MLPTISTVQVIVSMNVKNRFLKIEVLTPIYCCNLKKDVWSLLLFIQKVSPNLNSFISELLFKLWAWIEQLCK